METYLNSKKQKVIQAHLANPHWSLRRLSQETKVDYGTARRYLKDVDARLLPRWVGIDLDEEKNVEMRKWFVSEGERLGISPEELLRAIIVDAMNEGR